MLQATSDAQYRFHAQGVVHRFPSPERIKVRAGEPVFEEGESAEYFYKLVSGCVRLVKWVASGHRQICDFYLPGDLLGFSNADEHEFSAEAIEDGVLMRYRRRDADRLMKADPAFACELQTLTAQGLSSAYAHMVRLCHRSARDRLSWFLLDMARRSGSEWFTLPMSRVDVADYLGLAHETVSRVFTQLKKHGVIAEPKLNHVRIVNRGALEDGLLAA
ncbi:MAG: helix-turn-helix domain-containing protein [Proteobacteria bacterium]|nr:helix-turn-helix domain-containing protein [Pseudomonadota bacterium]